MDAKLAGYSGTPLVKKLGIKANTTVAVLHAPGDFKSTLGELPEGVAFRKQLRGGCALAIWFVRSVAELEKKIDSHVQGLGDANLWIAWPKIASGIVCGLSEGEVRRVALAAGLVDFKVCAIDATWSGLRFAKRFKEITKKEPRNARG